MCNQSPTPSSNIKRLLIIASTTNNTVTRVGSSPPHVLTNEASSAHLLAPAMSTRCCPAPFLSFLSDFPSLSFESSNIRTTVNISGLPAIAVIMFKSKPKPTRYSRPISFFPSMRNLFEPERLSSFLTLNSNADPLSEVAPMDDETARLMKAIDFEVGAGPTTNHDAVNSRLSNVAEEVEGEVVHLPPPPLALHRPRPVTNMMFDRSVDSLPELKKPTCLSSRFSSATFADDDDTYDFSDAFKTQPSHLFATRKLQKRAGPNGKVRMNYVSTWRVVWHGYTAAIEMAPKREVEMRRLNNRPWSSTVASRAVADAGVVATVIRPAETLRRGAFPRRSRMSSASQATTAIGSEASPLPSRNNSILLPGQPTP